MKNPETQPLPKEFKLCRVVVKQGRKSRAVRFVADVKMLGKKSSNAMMIRAMYKQLGFIKESMRGIPIAYMHVYFESGEDVMHSKYEYSRNIDSLGHQIHVRRMLVGTWWVCGVLADSVKELSEQEAQKWKLLGGI